MIETIKEFLVSLGFRVDSSSLNAADRAMKTAEKSVSHFASENVTNFTKAGAAVVTFVATANVALAKFLGSLAQADLANQIFARKMWMSVEAAKAYQSSLDALGVSLNDLYASPELMNKYLELNKLARNMAVPIDEYTKQMQGLREITFEWQKLKLEATYTLQWVGFYLTKILAGPLGDFKKTLATMNENIQKNMPKWSERVAEVASYFVRLGAAAWSIRSALGAIIGVFTGFKIISMLTNPLGLLIVGLTALLLLVDDLNTYTRGGESAFPKLWYWVTKFKEGLADNGTLKRFMDDLNEIIKMAKGFGEKIGKYLSSEEFKENLDNVIQKLGELKETLEEIGKSETVQNVIKDIKDIVFKLGEILQSTRSWFVDFFKTLKEDGDLKEFATDVGDLADSFLKLVLAIGDLMLKTGKGGLGEQLKKDLISILETIDGLIKSITGGLKIITGFLSGDVKGIQEGGSNVLEGADKALFGTKQGKEIYDWQDKSLDTAKKAREDAFNKGWENSFANKFSEALKPFKKGIVDFFSQMSTENPGNVIRSDNSSEGEADGKPNGTMTRLSNHNSDKTYSDQVGYLSDFLKVFKKGIVDFFSQTSVGNLNNALKLTSNYSSTVTHNYLYPQTTQQQGITQISLKPTYNIYGATNPNAVAQQTGNHTTALITRSFRGVIQ